MIIKNKIWYNIKRFGIKYLVYRLLEKSGILKGKSGLARSAYFNKLDENQFEDELKEWFLKLTGEVIDLEHPVTFNEKIQWLKLYDNTPIKARLADKYRVRSWIAEKIGEKYLIPLLGVWENFDQIDFNALPDKFVLKANNGCGRNLIIKDKRNIEIKKIKKKIDRWMSNNYAFSHGFELQYKDIPPKVIAEEYIENSAGDLYDYKVHCFSGEPRYIQFIKGRFTNAEEIFYNEKWEITDFVKKGRQILASTEKKPEQLEEMLSISRVLSEGFIYVRIDFYLLPSHNIYFGEMTFTPGSGTFKWNPPEANLKLGELIRLPGNKT
jgi:hypothetical protein